MSALRSHLEPDPSHRGSAATLGLAAAVALVTACATTSALTDADRVAIHRLDSAYVNAWLADDTAGVLATLDSGAMLMPAGQRPLTDLQAIRGFWWPNDGSRTKITSYSTTIDEITGGGDLAVVRGTGSLSFTYAKDSATTEATSHTMTLTVVTRGRDGRWRIFRRMWGPLAR